MSMAKDMQIVIEEIARVALEDPEMRSRIGHELNLSDEYLAKVFDFLESLVVKDQQEMGEQQI